ncbi:MAG: hypothetical protein IT376_15775 [Polyangiaceae bacterium]|nr:hypothetical protein [Polyangiaceae bacterium]
MPERGLPAWVVHPAGPAASRPSVGFPPSGRPDDHPAAAAVERPGEKIVVEHGGRIHTARSPLGGARVALELPRP